ncbi:shikimate 5-dehydrogenase [Rhodococcus hoagii]|nr:shikimate 5-dehydrogenase [Prescottella equi]
MSRTITGDVSKDTRLCMSLSGRPSNIGTRFHNYLYDELGLDFVYKAFTTTDLPASDRRDPRARHPRMRGVDAFKEACIEHVDVVHPSASAIDSVNTIVNEDGELHAYNTDYQAVADLLHRAELRRSSRSPSPVAAAWPRPWWPRCAIPGSAPSRSSRATPRPDRPWPAPTASSGFPSSGPPIRSCSSTPPRSGWPAAPNPKHCRFRRTRSTPRRRSSTSSRCPPDPDDPARDGGGKTVITGAEVVALQAAEQFTLYTGVRPTDEQIRHASEFSRAPSKA